MSEARTSGADLAYALVQSTTALVVIIDSSGRILLVNPAMQRFTGRTETELLGRPFWDAYVSPDDIPQAQQAVAGALADGHPFPEEGEWLAGDGTWRRVAMQNSVVIDAAGEPYGMACVAIDVTERRQQEALAQRRATTDALTGTKNRRVLFETLQQHLDPDTSEGCAVLFCDIDGFKAINDEHGHGVGDQLLVEVAFRLSDLAGPEALVARLGGDEFVVLQPGTTESALTERVRLTQTVMQAPLETPAGGLSFSISIGSGIGQPGDDPDAVLAHADRSMYHSKSHRRRSAR